LEGVYYRRLLGTARCSFHHHAVVSTSHCRSLHTAAFLPAISLSLITMAMHAQCIGVGGRACRGSEAEDCAHAPAAFVPSPPV
jgi:hypothetical protein